MRVKNLIALACALAFGLAVLPASSHAGTVLTSAAFSQTSDDSSNHQVGTNTANNVTVTNLFNGYLDIKVNLASGFQFVNTGNATYGSFVFGLSGISSLTFVPVNPTTFLDPAPGTWWPTGSVVTTASSNPVTVAKASMSESGKYLFSYGYGLMLETNGASGAFTPPLEFKITNLTTDLTIAAFLSALQSSTNSRSTGLCNTAPSSGCFYADVINGNSKTGLIDFGAPVLSFTSQQGSETPLPAALPLFATGLGAFGLLGWRRKRKAQAAA